MNKTEMASTLWKLTIQQAVNLQHIFTYITTFDALDNPAMLPEQV